MDLAQEKEKMTVIAEEEKNRLLADIQEIFPLMPKERLQRQMTAASWDIDRAIERCLSSDLSDNIGTSTDVVIQLSEQESASPNRLSLQKEHQQSPSIDSTKRAVRFRVRSQPSEQESASPNRLRSPRIISPIRRIGVIVDENEHQQSPSVDSTKLAVNFWVRREGPQCVLCETLQQLLTNCGMKLEGQLQWTKSIQTDFEDDVMEASGVVVVPMGDGREAITFLATQFSTSSAYGLEMQPLLDIVSMDRHYFGIRPQHSDIDLVYLAVGDMPNWGVFFVRGDYTPVPNRFGGPAGKDHPLTAWAEFEHDRRLITFFFAVFDANATAGVRGFKLVVHYDQFHSVIVDCGHEREENRSVFIQLRSPPQLWEAIPRKSDSQRANVSPQKLGVSPNGVCLNVSRCNEWLRTLSWPSGDHKGNSGCSIETLADSPVLCFSMQKKKRQSLREMAQGDSAQDLNSPTVQLFEIIGRWRQKTNCKIMFGAVKKAVQSRSQPVEAPDLGSVRANYSLEALLSRGDVVRSQLTVHGDREAPILYRRLQWCMQESAPATEEALERLLTAVDEKRNISLLNSFEVMYEQRLSDIRRAFAGEKVESFGPDVPSNCVLVRKLMIMPLRTLLMPPEVMLTNRVVRQFGHENALRCVFRDDNGCRLVANKFFQGRAQEGRSAIVEEMIRKALEEGVNVSGRRYEFLAWSNSQMRDHGCYMYTTTTYSDRKTGEVHEANIADIRRWMGDFTASKNVPKLMSRMGQCFTQAIPTIELKRSDWRLVRDVEGGSVNPETGTVYTFSDGIGRISTKAAELVAEKLDVTPVPSCFQMRFKGFKGVLTVDPQMDAEGKECVEFRDSQKKFEDPEDTSQMLEVVKYAMPSPVFLNRPFIMILDQVSYKHGRVAHERVKNRIFMLLEEQLNTMAGMLCNEEESAIALDSRLAVKIDFLQLRDNGFLLTKEPFFRSLLLAVHRYNIKIQLNKAKIAIPPTLGRTMYGVMDDTGLLEYGQVFIQYSPSVHLATEQVINHIGRVIVTKNPCLAPGDVRIFNAVYHSALSHLRDVIVFPRHGPRPHPDEMAGSDLDGDEYSVVFDTELMFDRNEEAMHFPKIVASDCEGPPTSADMVDFFLKYLQQDSIGRMSNAHLMAGDRRGIFDPVCEQIARKCSIAVDFPKSGHPADRLERDEQTYRAPDYMQKAHQPAYCSRRIVGQIYRIAKKVEDILDIGQFSVQDDSFDQDLYNDAHFMENQKAKRRACSVRDQYNSKIRHLMDEYGVNDEASLVSGHIVSIKNRISEHEKDDFSFYNTDKIVELRYGRIFDSFREEFFKEFGGEAEFIIVDADGRQSVRVNEALLNKAQAWYMVVYGPHASSNVTRFRSFPWIVWDILIHLKRRNVFGSSSEAPIMRLDSLPQELAAAIASHCANKAESMAQYWAHLVDHPTEGLLSLRRYCARYRHLDQLLFIVHNWVKTEGIFDNTSLRPDHLAILFLQFGLGFRETDVRKSERCARFNYLVEQVHEMPSSAEPSIDLGLMMGNYLLDFVKYLASYRFFTARCIQLREPNLCNPNSPGMLLNRPHQWRPLAAIAFKSFHHIALTRQFAALHIRPAAEPSTTADLLPWDYGETFEPITVELPSSLCAMADNPIALSDRAIGQVLKDWSKVNQIELRRAITQKNEQVFVSAAGTLEARQRLRRILFMETTDLLRHVRSGTVPDAARDEAL